MNSRLFQVKNLAVFVLLFILWGCDNTIAPFEQTSGNYSVYGVLDASKEVNYIRVKDLSSPIDEAPQTIDVSASLKNLATGRIETLKDTLIVIEGVNTHNFISRMDIETDSKYRLTLSQPNGKSFSVSASTPVKSDVNISTTVNSANLCNSNITTRFNPYDPELPIVAELGFESDFEINWFNLQFPQARNLGQDFIINFTISDMIVMYLLGGAEIANNCSVLSSTTVHFRYTHFGPEYLSNAASDSLNASGNVGNLIGVYTNFYSVTIPELEEVIGNYELSFLPSFLLKHTDKTQKRDVMDFPFQD